MPYDLHAHVLPPAWLEEVRRSPDSFGVHVEDRGDGGHRVTRADNGRAFDVIPELSDLSHRARGLADLGVGQQLAAPPTPLLLYDLDMPQAVAVSRLFNESVAELARSNGWLIPAATVPMCYPDEAVRELDHAVDTLGIRMLFLATSVAGSELDEPRFEPVLRRAAEHGVAVQLHPCSPDVDRRLQKRALPVLIGNPMETAVTAASLITGGVLDRIPDLRVLLVHGGGAFPALSGRVEHGYRNLAAARTSEHPPRDYLRRFYYDSVVHDANLLRFLAETVGVDRIVLGTDSPYPMGDPDPVGSVRKAGIATPAVLHDTAISLLAGEG